MSPCSQQVRCSLELSSSGSLLLLPLPRQIAVVLGAEARAWSVPQGQAQL